MSTPKIYKSQEFDQSQQIMKCPKCGQLQQTFIELSCGHKYCIICITFTYLKYKNVLENENQLKCLQCEKISNMDEDMTALIKNIISNDLGPIVNNDSDGNTINNNQSRMSINQGFANGKGAYNQGHSLQARSYERNYAKISNKNYNNFNLSKPITPSSSNDHTHIINHYNNNFTKNNQMLKEQKYTFKSQEQSLIAGHTPPKHPNRFYSKCETPQHSESEQQDQQQSTSIKEKCPIHPQEQTTYVCVTCSFKPGCLKCIHSYKHKNHEVKNIDKAIEIINEKLSLLNLETIEKIQNLELYQKRLYDRKLIYEERVQKSIKEIKQTFLSLQKKIVKKTNEIIDTYHQLCSTKIQQIQNRAQQNSEVLEKIKNFQLQINEFLTHTESVSSMKTLKLKPSKLIKQFQQIQEMKCNIFPQNQNQCHSSSIFKIHQQIIDPTNNYHNSYLIKQIGKISQEIENITIKSFSKHHHQQRIRFNETVPVASILKDDQFFMKNKTVALRECSSRDKIHNNNENNYEETTYGGKRIKTNNPISLNTSRDKRDKKHNTKTQQDEKRLKSKANYKTQANTMGKNSVNTATEKQSTKDIPTYITKCIQKHHTQNSRKVSPFSHTTTYMIENSKNISKIIGKTHNHQDLNNRKKMKDAGSCEAIKQKKQMIKSAKHVEGVAKKKKC